MLDFSDFEIKVLSINDEIHLNDGCLSELKKPHKSSL